MWRKQNACPLRLEAELPRGQASWFLRKFHEMTVGPRNPSHRYIPQITESVFSPVDVNVPSSTNHKGRKAQATQVSLNSSVDGLWSIHTTEDSSAVRRMTH